MGLPEEIVVLDLTVARVIDWLPLHDKLFE
jgi:hypothetical protein